MKPTNAGTARIVKSTTYIIASLAALGASTIVAMPATADSSITLRNEMNNKCLELLSFNNDNGARAGMWDCWGGANQHWYQ